MSACSGRESSEWRPADQHPATARHLDTRGHSARYLHTFGTQTTDTAETIYIYTSNYTSKMVHKVIFYQVYCPVYLLGCMAVCGVDQCLVSNFKADHF